MENILTFISEHHVSLVFGVLVIFGIVEVGSGYLADSKRNKDDVFVEVISTLFLLFITKPAVFFISFHLIKIILPDYEGFWKSLPFWAGLIVFLLMDDFLQYWYHRSSHEYKWLWKHHRPHHTATEMGLLVSYRESIYFFMMMPNIWWLGIFTYLGGGIPVAIGLVLKQIVIISSHSLAKWDDVFYKQPALTPIIKFLERIFITPAFHHSHHAVSKINDVGNPNGNFGNMFSIWDQIFGTATFKHAFPTEYGIPDDPKDSWQSHVFYPIVTSDKPNSELSKDFKFQKTTVAEPAILTLKEGNYLYCMCGYSRKQPFCDGSHHGTKFQPLKFSIKKDREYKLCQCKMCEKGPFCDNSHLKMKS